MRRQEANQTFDRICADIAQGVVAKLMSSGAMVKLIKQITLSVLAAQERRSQLSNAQRFLEACGEAGVEVWMERGTNRIKCSKPLSWELKKLLGCCGKELRNHLEEYGEMLNLIREPPPNGAATTKGASSENPPATQLRSSPAR